MAWIFPSLFFLWWERKRKLEWGIKIFFPNTNCYSFLYNLFPLKRKTNIFLGWNSSRQNWQHAKLCFLVCLIQGSMMSGPICTRWYRFTSVGQNGVHGNLGSERERERREEKRGKEREEKTRERERGKSILFLVPFCKLIMILLQQISFWHKCRFSWKTQFPLHSLKRREKDSRRERETDRH